MYSLRANQLLAHMRAGEVEHLYSMGNFATPRHLDYVCGSGFFQSIWIDLEHFDIPVRELAELNMVARAHPVTTVARFRATDYQSVMRVLESGVGGIMCAMVESADEVRQIVQWAKFNNPAAQPGEVTGMRGWNGGNVDARYGTVAPGDYVRHQNTEVAIICQIETPEAVAHLEEIAAVPGINGLFFGPGDYAHRIGRLGEISHPEVLAAIRSVAAACQQHGRFLGTIGIGREHYRQVRELGAKLICPGGDLRVMNLGLRELSKTFVEPGSNGEPGGTKPSRAPVSAKVRE